MKATDQQARESIVAALVAEQYNRTAAAKRLGISTSTLYRTMWQLGLIQRTPGGKGKRRTVATDPVATGG